MVLAEVVLLGDHSVRYTVPGKHAKQIEIYNQIRMRQSEPASDLPVFVAGDILHNVCHHRIFHDESADRYDAIQYVPGGMFVDFIRRAIGRTSCRGSYERAERRVFSAGDVRAVPPVFRFLR